MALQRLPSSILPVKQDRIQIMVAHDPNDLAPVEKAFDSDHDREIINRHYGIGTCIDEISRERR